MKISYSSHDKLFKKKLEGLLRSFSGNRGKILRSAFTALPWANVDFLSSLKKSSFKKIAIVGIGGSSLGLKALSQSLNKDDSVIFLDNVDPDFLESQFKKLKLKQTLFVLISKSGSTIEVLSISKWLIKKVGAARNFIAITDNEDSPLGRLAKKHKIPVFHSEKEIPGRFSVLSIVGLLPAVLLGIHPNKLLEGAREASWPAAYTLACYQYLHFIKGKNITVLFPYCESLSTFADWYIQLLSESIGKTKKIGITPIKAIGVKDQHSILQLFLDGPDDKFYIFIKPES
jgi:glucose-6-phosphate isomerase